ncbi:sensor histidine kinase [Pseudoalteromonas luteoviolacea B = ATCC 29581]|nr:sensor histidine kinase [Pseudoalteromonas luteoviolacea B = ATCC 29581]
MTEQSSLAKELALLKRQLSREREGKILAEELLESKSRALYEANQQLSSALETLKAQQMQMIQQEKLASIGLVAAGVAHEINTPAGFVACNLDVLNNYVKAILTFQHELVEQAQLESSLLTQLRAKHDMASIEEDMPDLIAESLTGIDRIAAIVRELRNFSRHGEDEKTKVNIDRLVSETLNLAAGQIKYHVEVITDLNLKTEILGIPGKLSQVFLNLIINAGQAIEGFGHLWISSYEEGESVYLVFRDDGIGMSESTLQKIFDAFFTTKPIGKGTGLGLSISMEIIHQHGGELTVSSILGKGSEFVIQLPKLSSEEGKK